MEQSRVSTPPAAHAHPVARSKAPAQAGAQGAPDAAGAAGGFLSLLSALGGDLEQDLQPPEADPAALLALQGGGVVDQGQGIFALADASAQAAVRGAELVPQGGLVAQTALIDAASETPALDGQGATLAGYRRAFSRFQGALAQGQGAAAPSSTLPGALGHRSTVNDKAVASASVASLSGLQSAPERLEAAMAPAAVPRALQDMAAGAQALPLPLATAESTRGSHILTRASEGGTGGNAMAGVWGSASYGPQGAPLAEIGSFFTDPAQAGAEEALAEQVAYWVSENLQNAQLTVTHEGQPVEVSVSMSGKEAHVTFRSDESQTRDLLDASMAQLRDLLHSEGLVLSGVSVGSSGGHNGPPAEGGSPRGRQGERSGLARVPAADMGAGKPRVLTDRAVDVFV